MLREKDVFNIDDVELAVLEANGKLTVYKKPQKTAVTAEDLGIAKTKKGLAYPIIVDGSVSEEVLSYLKKDMTWLESQLQAKGLRAKDIFFASGDRIAGFIFRTPHLVPSRRYGIKDTGLATDSNQKGAAPSWKPEQNRESSCTASTI